MVDTASAGYCSARMGEAASADEQGQRSVRRLMALPGYARLTAAYSLNELGWFFGTVALSVLVYRRTGSALGTTGFFLCSQAVPALIGPLFVGRTDRISPRRMLPALYWLEALLFALLAWLTTRFSLVPVLILVVLDGIVALVARSLASGARTELLKPVGMVREGGALNGVLFSVAYLIGPLLGGGATALGGTRAALLVSAGLFAVMGCLLVSPRIPASIVQDGPARGRLRAALRHIRRDRAVRRLFSLQAIVLVCFTIPTPIEVVYAVHTMHAGSAGYGVLLSVWGGAALLGSLAYARWRRAGAHVLLGSSIAFAGAGFAVMALAPSFLIGLVGAALAGMSNGLGTVAFGVEVQEIVPQSWIALTASVNQSLGLLSPGIGTLLGGVLAVLVSVRFAFGVAGAASLAFALVAVVVLAPGRLPKPEDGADAWSETDAGRRAGATAAGEAGGDGPAADHARTLA